MQVQLGNSSASHSSATGLTNELPSAAPNTSSSPSVGSDVPVSELAALAAAGAKLNRKQRRAVERHTMKLTSSAAEDTKPVVSAATLIPEQAKVKATSSYSEPVVGGTLAELTALKASGKPLNRKQRRAFERLSNDMKTQ